MRSSFFFCTKAEPVPIGSGDYVGSITVTSEPLLLASITGSSDLADKLLLATHPFNCECRNDLFEPVEESAQFECSMCKARYFQKSGDPVLIETEESATVRNDLEQ